MTGGRGYADRWREVEELLDRALEEESAARAAFLRAATDDDELRREVEELLRVAATPGPLDGGVGDIAGTLTSEAAGAAGEGSIEAGRAVGAWRIVKPLGGGGMGRVFLAEREAEGFEQAAALKLLRWELASPAMVERFRNEQQVLARLEHPGIARLIDGGMSEEGLPYLVMEHVDGRPIDRHCEERQLGLEGRLELFLQVCDAVQAAHRRLIVHRDLKPSNIFVSEDGRVKLLDFGVSKVLEVAGGGELTRTHLAPATPGFAAPEQLTGGEVTTATDVYALGAVLYQLLSGAKPFELDSTSPAEIAKVLEEAPAPPSTRVTGRSRARLAGDLDNIALTALRKEPERRYPSVDRLAADVRRYLAGKPVDATPETVGYRLGKFARRHQVAVAAAVLVLLAVMSGLAATLWQARKAEREARKATRVAEFLSSLFAGANPYNREVAAQSLGDVLEAAADRLETELRDEPEVRADLLTQIAIGHYRLLRQDERAWELLSEAERELEGRGDSAELAGIWLEKAWLAFARGDYERQAELARQSQDLFARTEGPQSGGVAEALIVRATAAHRGETDLEAADRLGREALAILEGLTEPRPLLMADCLAELGGIAESSGDLDRAIDLMNRALDVFESAGGASDPDVISLHNNMAIIFAFEGRFEEAERSYQRAIERHAARFGPDHPNAASMLTNFARLLLTQGRFDEALPFADRAVEAASTLPETNFERLAAEINQATARLETGAVDAAGAGYRSARDRFLEILGEDHPAVARIRSLLADALRLSGEHEAAEALYRLALDPANRNIDEAWLGLGRLLASTDRSAEARVLFEKTLAKRLETLAQDHWRVVEVRAELALLEAGASRNKRARAELERERASLASILSADNWRLLRLRG